MREKHIFNQVFGTYARDVLTVPSLVVFLLFELLVIYSIMCYSVRYAFKTFHTQTHIEFVDTIYIKLTKLCNKHTVIDQKNIVLYKLVISWTLLCAHIPFSVFSVWAYVLFAWYRTHISQLYVWTYPETRLANNDRTPRQANTLSPKPRIIITTCTHKHTQNADADV